MLQSQTTKDVLQSVLKVRKSWKTLRGGETVWPLELEAALLEGLENYQPDDSRETRMLGRFPRRNRFISDYIFEKTGKRRSAKQVGSRLQQLRESCGGKKLLHLLSPFRQPAYAESCSSGDSPCTSPTSPSMGERGFPPSSRHTVMYIDIIPEGSPDEVYSFGPPLWSGSGDIVHASDRPRRLRTINPTVTFMSQTPLAAQSRFTVYSEERILHTETVPLSPVVEPAQQVSGFLYSTTLVPEYWKVISESPDPTRFIIYQEVVKDDVAALVFSATYKFSYPTSRHLSDCSSSLNTMHSLSTRPDIDSLVSAASAESAQFPEHRYPLYVSPEWPTALHSRENSPSQGQHSPSSDSSTCFPSELSNYVL